MDDSNSVNRESVGTQNRDEEHRLLPFPQNPHIATTLPSPSSPISPLSYTISGNFGDVSPPGTYYTTIHSTGSRRYEWHYQ